jgi:hypothetical protein
LDLALSDWLLVTNVSGVNNCALGKSNLEHRHDSAELEMVKSLDEWLILINDCDVADLVDLMKTLNSVLDKLSEVNS